MSLPSRQRETRSLSERSGSSLTAAFPVLTGDSCSALRRRRRCAARKRRQTSCSLSFSHLATLVFRSSAPGSDRDCRRIQSAVRAALPACRLCAGPCVFPSLPFDLILPRFALSFQSPLQRKRRYQCRNDNHDNDRAKSLTINNRLPHAIAGRKH